MLLLEYCPVLDLKRGDVVDQRFFGIAALYDLSSGVPVEIKKTGNDNNHPFFLRSLLKPIQASIMADYNTAEFYGFSNAELAVMQASHAGETVHTELVLSILKKTGLNEKYLKCPAIFPLNPNILQPGENPKSMHNNCSAKHAMMLAVSKQLNFSLEDYTDVNHPLQKIILKKICELSEYCSQTSGDFSCMLPEEPPRSFDGCTVPVWALPFQNIANAFLKLYTNEKYSFLKSAYKENPYIIGGCDASGYRQDTHIMMLNPELISKTGAGGFLSIYNDDKKEFLLIKMAQDNNKARFLFALNILEKLGWIQNNPLDYNFYDEAGRAVGKYLANF